MQPEIGRYAKERVATQVNSDVAS